MSDVSQLRPSWVRKINVTRVEGCPVPGDCWLWQGANNGKGYGLVYVNKRTIYLHRHVYELLVAPIPEGLHLDHLCRQPACCAPYHVEPVTPLVNTRRGVGHGSETHCPKGHEYNATNTHIYANAKGGPRRICKPCRRDYMVEYRALRKAQREQTWALYLGEQVAS